MATACPSAGSRVACIWMIAAIAGLPAAIAGLVVLVRANNAPSGPLGLWWDVSLCRNDSATFLLSGTIWRVYSARPVVPGALPGTPCPLKSDATDAPVELAVFPDVGFRRFPFPAEYRPLVLLPTGAYALGTWEVVDANNKTVYVEPLAFGVGGDSPPWIGEVNATAAPPFPPERPPSPPNTHGCVPLVAKCDYGCSQDGTGVCDDGGPGATHSRCWLGTDCSDCGERHIGATYCTDECSYANDGACDDGGAGAEYDYCASLNFPPSPPPTGPPPPNANDERRVTTDCTDCGGTVDRFCAPPSAPPRAVFSGDGSGGRRMSVTSEPAADPRAAHRAAPRAEHGRRVLLKGGSRRFGGSFGSTGYVGSYRAGVPSQSYYYSSGYYYYYGGYSCYSCRRRYGYKRQEGTALVGSRIVVVGCYFSTENCFPCGEDECYRQPGGHNTSWQYVMLEPRDLNEITEGASFTPPAPGSAAWPLRVVLRGLRVYRAVAEGEVTSTASPAQTTRDERSFPIHVSFTTNTVGVITQPAVYGLLVLGLASLIAITTLFILVKGMFLKERLRAQARKPKAPNLTHVGARDNDRRPLTPSRRFGSFSLRFGREGTFRTHNVEELQDQQRT